MNELPKWDNTGSTGHGFSFNLKLYTFLPFNYMCIHYIIHNVSHKNFLGVSYKLLLKKFCFGYKLINIVGGDIDIIYTIKI